MFIDCHLHVRLKDSFPRDGHNYPTPEELLKIMDRTGVDRGVLLPGVSPECRYQCVPTEDILEIAGKYPLRFIPFCNIDPRQGANSPSTDFSQLLNYYRDRGCKGLGELTANLYFDDPLVLNLFKHCELCKMPALFHVGHQIGGCYGLVDELGFRRLEKCLRLFPKLIFIGHSQPFWASISNDITEEQFKNSYPKGPIQEGGTLTRFLDAYPNLYCDISAMSGYNALTRDHEFGYRFMERYQDRLLFGTDISSPKINFRHADFLKDSLHQGNISKETFEKITHKNIIKIIQ